LVDQGFGKRSPRFCDYTDSHYRTDFWEGRGRDYENIAERIALRRLLPTTGHRIIDIGGGFGRLVDLYSGYREIVLLDYSISELQDARASLTDSRITYVAASLYEMPFVRAAFDAAVMVRVLHHQSDVPAALRAIHEILSPNAAFVLEYANKRHLKAILRYLLRRQEHNPFSRQPWEFAELNFDFHPTYVESSLEEAGFHIEQHLATSHFRAAFLKRLFPPRLLATVDGWLQQPTASLRLTPSIFLRARTLGGESTLAAPPIFRCPRCSSRELVQVADALNCTQCDRHWSTAGGIYDFRKPIP